MNDNRKLTNSLLGNIKAELVRLEELLAKNSGEWTYQDPIYRYYHHSYKVYHLQEQTEEIVATLQRLMPDRKLNEMFLRIVAEGTGKQFKREDNLIWETITRPIVEAFLHARFFLEMACIHGRNLEESGQILPSRWAALLYLYNLR